MADFKNALQEGQQAYDRVESDRREISGIISELSIQTSDFTQDKVAVGIKRFRLTENLTDMVAASFQSVLVGRYRYKICYILKEDAEQFRELAEWIPTGDGYPVMVKFDALSLNCHDRESLEQTLIRLVKTPAAGRALSQLRSREAPPSNASKAT